MFDIATETHTVAGTLDLRDLAQLHTLSFDTSPPIEPRVLWLAGNLVFPPPEQALGLVLHVGTDSARPDVVQLADADRALALLPCITSVTVILAPLDGGEPRARELIDVSGAFVQGMPLLVSRLAGSAGLRVLRSP